MTVVGKAQHWDERLIGGGQRRRSISNWRNWYNRQTAQWETVDLDVEDDQTTPPEWGNGTFEFQYQVKKSNLQIYAEDLSDPGDSAVIGLRRADAPNKWMNIKAWNADTSAGHTVFPAKKAIKYLDLWTNCDLWWQAVNQGVRKQIDLKAAGHPAYFEFMTKMPKAGNVQAGPGGHIGVVVGGNTQIQMRAPYAWDADGDEHTDRNIPVTMTIESNQVNGAYRYVKLRLTPDVTGATYPVHVDPTTVISGTTDIVDNYLHSDQPTHNFGGAITMLAGTLAGWSLRPIMRVSSAALPSGAYTAARFTARLISSVFGGTLNAHEIKAANVGWAEGTDDGFAEEGSTCWDYYAWSAGTPTNWAGGAGMVAGTDYEAATMGSQAYPNSSPVDYTMTFSDISPFESWRDGGTNSGIFFRTAEGAADYIVIGTTENGTAINNPEYEIDWAPAGGAKRASDRSHDRGHDRGHD